MSQKGPSTTTHESINGFNGTEVSTYLRENYDKAISEAQSQKNTVIYKPTSGSWTSGKSTSGANLNAKTNSILSELTKAIRPSNTEGKPQGGNQSNTYNNNQQQKQQRKHSRS